jgi:hypothetical protein
MNHATFAVRKWTALLAFIVYSFVSLFLTLFTVTGWAGLAVILYLPFVYLILLFMNAVAWYGIQTVYIRKDWLFLTLGLQIVWLLGNSGDCGDAEGFPAPFIMRAWDRTMECTGSILRENIGRAILIVALAYFVCMFYTMKVSYVDSKKAAKH